MKHSANDMGIIERAADWLEEIDNAGPQQRAAFLTWLKESPRHVEEFLLVAAVYREFTGVDPDRRIDLQALIAHVAPNVVPVQELMDPGPLPKGEGMQRDDTITEDRRVLRSLFFWERSGRSRRRRWAVGAAAATVAGAVALGWLWLADPAWQRYTTAVGEQRVVELADGSVVYLNTQSEIKVRLSETGRDVRLVDGEAIFKVAQQAQRPFRVNVDSAVVQAVGTQFNVYRRVDQTTVSVIEGKVKVSPEFSIKGSAVKAIQPAISVAALNDDKTSVLAAGQRVNIDSRGAMTRLAEANKESVTAWRERRLIFKNDTLKNVATEFNRYNTAPRVQVEGVKAAERRLTGIFDADDPESLLLFLENSDLRVQKTAKEVIITAP